MGYVFNIISRIHMHNHALAYTIHTRASIMLADTSILDKTTCSEGSMHPDILISLILIIIFILLPCLMHILCYAYCSIQIVSSPCDITMFSLYCLTILSLSCKYVIIFTKNSKILLFVQLVLIIINHI